MIQSHSEGKAQTDKMPAFEGESDESQPFEPDLLAEWWATISDPRFTGLGLGQLASAWVGAIHVWGEAGGHPTVVQFDDVREFLARFQHPLWPDDLTTSRCEDVDGFAIGPAWKPTSGCAGRVRFE